MDLKSLIAKMTAIEESEQVSMTSPNDQILTGSSVDECGDMPMPGAMAHSDPKQQDNVTMNVSMNGSGAGGIRDLMDILRNLEDGAGQQEPEEIELSFGETVPGSNATTEPSPEVFPMAAAIPTGDDLASKGIEAPKVNGGGNPMHEALTSRLYRMYQTIKEDAGQQDLGNGFVLASIEAFGSTRPAVLDTQSNTYYILNQQGNGGAIARTPAKYLTIKDGKTGASMGGPQTDAAFQKAGLIK